LAGVHCRIKRDPQKQDLTLVVSERPATAAGVLYEEPRLRRAGDLGPQPDAQCADPGRGDLLGSGQRVHRATRPRGCPADGPPCRRGLRRRGRPGAGALDRGDWRALPMDRIQEGIAAAAGQLGTSDAHLQSRRPRNADHRHRHEDRRSRGFDRRPPHRNHGGRQGAAMMGPNMATMLALLMTDAPLDPDCAQAGAGGSDRGKFSTA